MQIAVIADTHDRFPESVGSAIRGADEIWHLGDVMNPEILHAVRALGPPVLVVRGNNDDCLEWPMTVDVRRGGFSIRLIHIPPPESRMPDVDILLHGHTHVPRDEWIGGTRVLNPGTVGKPNKGAPPGYAWLEIEPDPRRVTWQWVRI